MNLSDVNAVLSQRQETRIELGLDRLKRQLGRMGEPQRAFPAVLVAGTNGKGSVCALLAAALQAAGYRTGLYTSPHLVSVTERIQINGVPAGPEQFASAFERVLAAETGSEPLTYFELLTAAAFEHFRSAKVDIAVLEVGLGGRLDATNCAERVPLSIVTTIHYDHTDLLGETLTRIAGEKAGIFRSGSPAITGETADEPMAALLKAAKAAGTALAPAPRPFRVAEVRWEQGSQVMDGPAGERFEVGLLGKVHARNAALAHAALRLLGTQGFPVSPAAEASGFKRVRWPGRFEVRGSWILDGAHNPQAMQAFVETFQQSPWAEQEVTFILGFLKDKDYGSMISILAPLLGEVVVCAPVSPRALPAQELSKLLRKLAPGARVTVAASPAQAFGMAAQGPAAVCGSFYLVGAALKHLDGARV